MMEIGTCPNASRRFGVSVVVACLLCSGFLALCYEICWIRKASLVFGTASFALSTVLGVFFAGLAIGSYLSGRYSKRMNHPLRAYAFVELGVGVAAIISPTLFATADAWFNRLYPLVFNQFWALSGVRLLLMTAILLPPAVFIGSTLPIICRLFTPGIRNVQRSVGLLYGVNTMGAAVGCAACGFVMIPRWGADAILFYGGICNLILAGLAWSAARQLETTPNCGREASVLLAESRLNDARIKRQPTFVFIIIFFLAGFVALGHEIVWARFLSLLMYNTVYTYTLTLTVILCGIVLGSILAATPLLKTQRPATMLGAVQVAIAVTVLGTLLLPVEFWQRWREPESVARQLILVALIMLPSAILSGIAFPLAARLITCQAAQTAERVGWLSGINTAGGLAGSLLVGFGMLPRFGLYATVLLTTAASVLGALILWWSIDEQIPRRTRTSLSVIAVGVWLLVPLASGARLPADYLGKRGELVDFREGLSGQVAVIREDGCLRLEVDRLWQGENRRTHQVVAAHLPMLLHENPQRVLVVGLGAGLTASRFLMYPIERLDCVDLESELLTLLPDYFFGNWLRDSRVQCVIEDGRSFVQHIDRRYDVISIEVGQAFRPGVAAFYTHEFYEHAKQKLRSDGLLTQFVSLEFFNHDELRSVIGTFAGVFPECALFHNRSELLLVGKRDGKLTLTSSRLEVLTANDRVRRDLQFGYWGAADKCLCVPEVFAANFLAAGHDLREFASGARIARDDVPWLEFSTSSHRTPDLSSSTEELARHLSPVKALLRSVNPQQQNHIAAIRRQNLDNLQSEECIWQAKQHLENDRAAAAIAQLRKALEWNDENIAARILLGDIHAAQKDYLAAANEFHAALVCNPDLHPVEIRLKAIAALRSSHQ